MFFDDKIEKIMEDISGNDHEYFLFKKYDIPRIKEEIEELWKVYKNYASKGFKLRMIENKRTFYQYWWEMNLTVRLINLGLNVEINYNNNGPDIKVMLNGIVYWIECIAPTKGENAYSVPEFKVDEGPKALPRDALLLRISSALNDKLSRFNEYKNKGIVKENDKMIIALSTAMLGQYGSLMDFPELAIDTILYNKGNLSINLITGQKRILKKDGIRKGKGIISTHFFENECMIHGILYSHAEPLNSNKEIYLRERNEGELCEIFKSKFSTV